MRSPHARAAVRRHRRRRPTARRDRLPARHRHRHRGVPRRPARQAAAGRGPGRRRQDRTGPRGRAGAPAPGWCGCSATRASTRPARSTSGTTPSRSCASRPGCDGDWDQTKTDVFSEEFLLHAAAADRDPAHRADGAADRRDRQGRHRDRGSAARGAVRLRRHRAGTGHHHRRAQAVRRADLQRHPRAVRGAQASLPVPAHRLPRPRPRAAHPAVAGARAARAAGRGTGPDHRRAARHAAQEAAVGGRDHRLGPHAAGAGPGHHRATRPSPRPSVWCSSTSPTRSRPPGS